MGKESGQFNNMLEIFADAEKERMIINTAMGVYEKYKQFKIRHFVSKKDVVDLERLFNRIGNTDVPEVLKYLNLSSAEAIIYNDTLKEMIKNMVIEMIKQGVIVLEIEDCDYDFRKSQLTLTFMAVNPKSNIKRIDIQTSSRQ